MIQLDQAQQLYQDGKLEPALERLEPLVKPPPQPQALRLLFKIYAELRSIQRAERTYRTLLGANLPDGQLYALHLDMARIYHECLQATRSLEAIERAISLNPANREAYDLLVKVHESSQGLDKAAERLQRSLDQQPNNADLHTILARIYEKMGWWVEARDAAKTACRLRPSMAEPQHILRRVEQRLEANPHLFQEAAGRRQAVGDIEGMLRHWFAWAEATQQADDFVTVAELGEEHGQFGPAEYAFKRAVQLEPGHSRAQVGLNLARTRKKSPLPLDKSLYNAAELELLFAWFIQRQDIRGAIGFLRRYLDRRPNFVPALRFLVQAHRAAGQLEAASQVLELAIDKATDATKPDLYYDLGTMRLAQGRREEAKRAFRSALEYTRDHAEAKKQLAALSAAEIPPAHVLYKDWEQFRTSGRYKEALAHFQRLRDLDPYAFQLYIFMGYAYEALGQIEQAYQAHKHAALLEYKDVAFVKLATFCARNGLHAEAEEAFELALKVNPHNREAQRGLAGLPTWIASEEERLKSRAGRPDDQYLYAIWRIAKREKQADEAVKYFARLAEVMPESPILFSLLGQANEEAGNIQAAAVAYRHEAALKGAAKNYVKLGDFCFRNALEAMAREAYQTTLELNPFYQHAKNRLAFWGRGQAAQPNLISGNDYTEDLARDLADAPGDRGKAEKLRTEFSKNRAVKYAEATYRLLQKFYPEQPGFIEDLVRVYLACGQPQLAWLEGTQSLALGTVTGKPLTVFEALVRQAERDITQLGAEQPSLPAKSPPAVDSIAPTIATDWYLYQPTSPVTQDMAFISPAELLQQAAEGNIAQSQHFLAAATFYHRAGQADKAIDYLVGYGQTIANYYRQRGQTDLAQELVSEAMRLALLQSATLADQQAALADYILDYLDHLTRGFGLPPTWPAVLRTEVQNLLTTARSLALPRLGHLLDRLASLLREIQQPAVDQPFLHPAYQAAIIQRRSNVTLRLAEQNRLQALLKRWLSHLPPSGVEMADRARLTISLPQILPVPDNGAEAGLEVEVKVSNTGRIPADCLWLTLSSGADFRSRQFMAFLPGGATRSVIFLINVPVQPGYAELNLDAGYFDPVERQQLALQTGLTLRQTHRPFQPVGNPYRLAWTAGRKFEPEYLPRAEAERRLTQPAQGVGLEWKPEALNLALDLTAGEWSTLELLAGQVVIHLNQVERGVVLVGDIKKVADIMLARHEGYTHFAGLLENAKALSPTDKLILACLAARVDDPAVWIRQEDLLRDLERWGNRLSMDDFFPRTRYLQIQLPLLETAETLDDNCQYRLKIGLFHAWLRRYWLPGQAFANLRQFQRAVRRKKADDLRQKLAEALAEARAYQTAKTEFDKGKIGIGQFSKLETTYFTQRNKLFFDIRGILTDEEYQDASKLLDLLLTDAPERTIREALQAVAQQRGWDEQQVKQRLGGRGSDILSQIADFILDVWEA